MELNRLAPDFELPGLDGRLHRLSDYRGRVVMVNFWSADCPHVERTDVLMLASLRRWGADVVLLSIASNANESLSALENASRSRGLPIVLKDAGHVVADLCAAQVTPEVFVVDCERVLRYRGAVDDVGFRQRIPTRSYLEDTIESLSAGRSPNPAETVPYGCTIVRHVL
jgi:peroxiredoxin